MSDDFETRKRRDEAKEAGKIAFTEGSQCKAPEYRRGDLEASWRVGWKIAAAKAGVRIPADH